MGLGTNCDKRGKTMVQKQNIAGFDTVTIATQNGLTRATFVPERGGNASSIVMPGHDGPHELIYHFPHFWDRTATDLPGGWMFCFPNCGRLESNGKINHYQFEGKTYQLPIHGFGWSRPWTLIDAGDDHLTMELRDDDQTRTIYPFHFTVQLHYEIAHRRLFCRQTYTNHGSQPMPYYAGFHPYFLTPEPNQGKSQVILNFQMIKRFLYNEQLTKIIGEQPLFRLPSEITNPEIHEQLLQLGEDKNIHLAFPNKDVIYFSAEGVEDTNLFPYVQIYAPQDQPFICVEPWMGYPNALNDPSAVRWLQPGQSEHGVLRLWLE